MDRIEQKFNFLKQKQEKALVGFVTAGDPDLKRSLEIVNRMIDSGIDILELGVPFSDPSADGPVIQKASKRALENGVTLEDVLEMSGRIRENSQIPIIIFTYSNEFLQFKEAENLSLIRLIAPVTPYKRMKMITESASGFIYLISKTGITGSVGFDADKTSRIAKNLRSATNLPICTGFGISTPDHVKEAAGFSDGIVIGSAFVAIIEENLENQRLPELIKEAALNFKEATRTVK